VIDPLLDALMVVADWFENGLLLETVNISTVTPEVIVVLAGGYFPGPNPDKDTLTSDTTRRVLGAVSWWKKIKSSKLVMAGRSPVWNGRQPQRVTDLMKSLAVYHGVPENQILKENRSSNTWEHPKFLLEMPGIFPTTIVGVVTSGWHLRRAVQEFRKVFHTVIPLHPVTPVVKSCSHWSCWIPQTGSLSRSTTMIHEWLGMGWYWLKSLTNGVIT
ncbi:MAG: YdcF family protein, partial [Thermodesulfobacteriota bacterium]